MPGTVGWTARDLHAWAILRPLLDAGPYLPWSEGAMRPCGLVELCNAVALDRPGHVLELGSGCSTILLARLLRTIGGRLLAVEHDERWAGWVRAQLETEGLDTLATVLQAPLVGTPAWYERSALTPALAADPPGLVIVDGPPAHAPGQGEARGPALDAVLPHLAPGARIVLDDIARPGEQAVLDRWEQETPLRFTRDLDAGIATARL